MPMGNDSMMSASFNCFENATDQRTPWDCMAFYSSHGVPYEGPTLPAQHSSKRKRRHLKLKYILIAAAAIACGALLLLLALITVSLCVCFASSSRRQRPGVTESSNNRDEQQPDNNNRDEQQQPDNGPGPIPETIINVAHLETLSQRTESFVTDCGTHFVGTHRRGPTIDNESSVPVGEPYSYDQLLEASAGFSDENLIHLGRTGAFYEGRLVDGTRVAVKRMGPAVADRASIVAAELGLFAKGMNRRLVELMGHCLDGGKDDETFLVYRMVKYGDLESVFHRKPCVEKGDGQDEVQSLDWITRLKIATGVAQALCHLHCDCDPPIVHRDVQASSILLDDKFEVRLTSLSENCVDENTRLHKFSSSNLEASTSSSRSQPAACTDDVYNLGLVLLELITGQSPRATSDWLSRVLPCIDNDHKELITQVVDPCLTIDEDHLEEVWGVALLAKACLISKPNKRPNIRHVIKALENPLKLARGDSLRKLRATSARGSWNTHFWGDSNGGSRRSEVAPEP